MVMKSDMKMRQKPRRKMCRFCCDPDLPLSYQESKFLEQFLTASFKILPRRITGNCARHQRLLTQEIKRARILAYLPFTTAHH